MKICKNGKIWGQMNTDYHDPEYIKKQREAKLGDKNPNWKGGISPIRSYIKKGYNPNSIGRPFQKGHPPTAGSFPKGEKHPRWKGGITPLNYSIRTCSEYKKWRLKILERDNFRCVACQEIGGNLKIHHIKPFSQILEENHIHNLIEAQFCDELWIVDNGVTLCESCHIEVGNIFGRKGR